MKQLDVAVVLPCLDEETTLRETCECLGFLKEAEDRRTTNSFLFIVDNGSTDGTLDVAHEIQRAALQESVFIGQEQERGYVPPRHTGNLLVKEFAQVNNLNLDQILILQADADTYYGAGYIESMRRTSRTLGSNALLEGIAELPLRFRKFFPEYVALCSEIDDNILTQLGIPESSQLICTDAVCAYRLSDYFTWGGHLREYGEGGDEIHAETTRLYLRGLPCGARKIRVAKAVAYPSERKMLLRPAEELATAGFPREGSWKAKLDRQYFGPTNLEALRTVLNHPQVTHAIQLRERHMIALFGVLPRHVARAGGYNPVFPLDTALHEIATTLPKRDMETLCRQPGVFLSDILGLVDDYGPQLSAILQPRAKDWSQH